MKPRPIVPRICRFALRLRSRGGTQVPSPTILLKEARGGPPRQHPWVLVFTRTLALFLSLALAAPSPALALRPQEKVETAGLEELDQALRSDEPNTRLAQAVTAPTPLPPAARPEPPQRTGEEGGSEVSEVELSRLHEVATSLKLLKTPVTVTFRNPGKYGAQETVDRVIIASVPAFFLLEDGLTLKLPGQKDPVPARYSDIKSIIPTGLARLLRSLRRGSSGSVRRKKVSYGFGGEKIGLTADEIEAGWNANPATLRWDGATGKLSFADLKVPHAINEVMRQWKGLGFSKTYPFPVQFLSVAWDIRFLPYTSDQIILQILSRRIKWVKETGEFVITAAGLEEKVLVYLDPKINDGKLAGEPVQHDAKEVRDIPDLWAHSEVQAVVKAGGTIGFGNYPVFDEDGKMVFEFMGQNHTLNRSFAKGSEPTRLLVVVHVQPRQPPKVTDVYDQSTGQRLRITQTLNLPPSAAGAEEGPSSEVEESDSIVNERKAAYLKAIPNVSQKNTAFFQQILAYIARAVPAAHGDDFIASIHDMADRVSAGRDNMDTALAISESDDAVVRAAKHVLTMKSEEGKTLLLNSSGYFVGLDADHYLYKALSAYFDPTIPSKLQVVKQDAASLTALNGLLSDIASSGLTERIPNHVDLNRIRQAVATAQERIARQLGLVFAVEDLRTTLSKYILPTHAMYYENPKDNQRKLEKEINDLRERFLGRLNEIVQAVPGTEGAGTQPAAGLEEGKIQWTGLRNLQLKGIVGPMFFDAAADLKVQEAIIQGAKKPTRAGTLSSPDSIAEVKVGRTTVPLWRAYVEKTGEIVAFIDQDQETVLEGALSDEGGLWSTFDETLKVFVIARRGVNVPEQLTPSARPSPLPARPKTTDETRPSMVKKPSVIPGDLDAFLRSKGSLHVPKNYDVFYGEDPQDRIQLNVKDEIAPFFGSTIVVRQGPNDKPRLEFSDSVRAAVRSYVGYLNLGRLKDQVPFYSSTYALRESISRDELLMKILRGVDVEFKDDPSGLIARQKPAAGLEEGTVGKWVNRAVLVGLGAFLGLGGEAVVKKLTSPATAPPAQVAPPVPAEPSLPEGTLIHDPVAVKFSDLEVKAWGDFDPDRLQGSADASSSALTLTNHMWEGITTKIPGGPLPAPIAKWSLKTGQWERVFPGEGGVDLLIPKPESDSKTRPFSITIHLGDEVHNLAWMTIGGIEVVRNGKVVKESVTVPVREDAEGRLSVRIQTLIHGGVEVAQPRQPGDEPTFEGKWDNTGSFTIQSVTVTSISKPAGLEEGPAIRRRRFLRDLAFFGAGVTAAVVGKAAIAKLTTPTTQPQLPTPSPTAIAPGIVASADPAASQSPEEPHYKVVHADDVQKADIIPGQSVSSFEYDIVDITVSPEFQRYLVIPGVAAQGELRFLPKSNGLVNSTGRVVLWLPFGKSREGVKLLFLGPPPRAGDRVPGMLHELINRNLGKDQEVVYSWDGFMKDLGGGFRGATLLGLTPEKHDGNNFLLVTTKSVPTKGGALVEEAKMIPVGSPEPGGKKEEKPAPATKEAGTKPAGLEEGVSPETLKVILQKLYVSYKRSPQEGGGLVRSWEELHRRTLQAVSEEESLAGDLREKVPTQMNLGRLGWWLEENPALPIGYESRQTWLRVRPKLWYGPEIIATLTGQGKWAVSGIKAGQPPQRVTEEMIKEIASQYNGHIDEEFVRRTAQLLELPSTPEIAKFIPQGGESSAGIWAAVWSWLQAKGNPPAIKPQEVEEAGLVDDLDRKISVGDIENALVVAGYHLELNVGFKAGEGIGAVWKKKPAGWEERNLSRSVTIASVPEDIAQKLPPAAGLEEGVSVYLNPKIKEGKLFGEPHPYDTREAWNIPDLWAHSEVQAVVKAGGTIGFGNYPVFDEDGKMVFEFMGQNHTLNRSFAKGSEPTRLLVMVSVQPRQPPKVTAVHDQSTGQRLEITQTLTLPAAGLEEVVEDYGEVDNWDGAFSKARDLLRSGTIQAVATVSLSEFQSSRYAATMLDSSTVVGLDMTGEQALDLLAQFAPRLYPDNVKFHLLRTKIRVGNAPGGKKEFFIFAIVYLKSGQEFRSKQSVPALPKPAGLEEGLPEGRNLSRSVTVLLTPPSPKELQSILKVETTKAADAKRVVAVLTFADSQVPLKAVQLTGEQLETALRKGTVLKNEPEPGSDKVPPPYKLRSDVKDALAHLSSIFNAGGEWKVQVHWRLPGSQHASRSYQLTPTRDIELREEKAATAAKQKADDEFNQLMSLFTEVALGEVVYDTTLERFEYAAGLEEKGVGVAEGTTVENLVVPWSGLRANWYTKVAGQEIPTELLDFLDPEANRILLPKADIGTDTTVLVQEGVLNQELIQAIREAGVAVSTFDLGNVPQPEQVPGREYLYVMDVPVGSEREWVLNPSAMVINLSPAIPDRRPTSPAELGALINAAREAEGRVLRVGGIYRSFFQDSLIAIDTQL